MIGRLLRLIAGLRSQTSEVGWSDDVTGREETRCQRRSYKRTESCCQVSQVQSFKRKLHYTQPLGKVKCDISFNKALKTPFL